MLRYPYLVYFNRVSFIVDFGWIWWTWLHYNEDWVDETDNEIPEIYDLIEAVRSGEYDKRRKGTDYIEWYGNLHHCKFLVYEDMCFQRFDLWGRDFGIADPVDKPLLLINKKAYLDEKFSTKFTLNLVLIKYNFKAKFDKPKILLFYKTRLINLLLPVDFKLLWKIWPVILNQSPYQLSDSITDNYGYDRNFYLNYKTVKNIPKWILIPNLLTKDWPVFKPTFSPNWVQGRQIMFFFDHSLVYLPKINFPLTNFQINYTIRHYLLQLKEQLYFEKWYRIHKKNSLKLEIYKSNYKNGIKWWLSNRFLTKELIYQINYSKIIIYPKTNFLIKYTSDELIRSVLNFFIKDISLWWFKSLYHKRFISFRFLILTFPVFKRMRRSIHNLKFTTVYFFYTTIKFFNQTQINNRSYTYLYYDTILWLLWKLKTNQFYKTNYSIKLEPFWNQDFILKYFFCYLLSKEYVQQNFYLFENMRTELYKFTGQKVFFDLDIKNNKSVNEVYNFVINYYSLKLKAYIFSKQNRQLTWDNAFYYKKSKLTYIKFSRYLVFYSLFRLKIFLINQVKQLTYLYRESWEYSVINWYFQQPYILIYAIPGPVYNWLNIIKNFKFFFSFEYYFHNDIYIRLLFNKFEYYNLAHSKKAIIYNPERVEEDRARIELLEREKNYSKFFTPSSTFEYNHGKIRVRFRSFNYKYFNSIKDQQILIDYFNINWLKVSKYNKSIININPVFFKNIKPKLMVKEIRPVFQFFALLNAFEAIYHFNRFQYTQTLIATHKDEYLRGIAKKKFYVPERKYSSIFGWENWIRCYGKIKLGKLWPQVKV